jgi:N-acetylmuramoyl-L-alanine amidase
METPLPPLPENKSKNQNSGGALQSIQIVIGVAVVLATLFTAWTPAGLLPDSLSERVSGALGSQELMSATAFPTATARPHLRIGVVSGHWGSDSGAVCPDGLTEAEINLEIATRVKDSLVGHGYEVDLLREFDTRLIGYKAMVLVSIHADSCNYINDQATGFKVSSAVSTMYPENANRLTSCLRTRYTEATNLTYHQGSVTPDMTHYHAFDEIHHETTAAIIETGFMNLDRQILTEQPEIVAQGIIDGILCFVRNEDITKAAPTEP